MSMNLSSFAFTARRCAAIRLMVSGSLKRTGLPSASHATRRPASSNNSRKHATKYARPPLSMPSRLEASASVIPMESFCPDAPASPTSTPPPGKTYAPPMKSLFKFRFSMRTSKPSGASRRVTTVAAGLGVRISAIKQTT